MQIREITQQLNENALGAFGAGFSQATGINMPKLGGDSSSSTTAYKYGPAAQQQAAKLSAPVITQMADKELANWNASVLNLLKQNGVASTASLDRATKQSLARSLVTQVQKNFMQNKAGADFKSLPKLVSADKQAEAEDLVKQIQISMNNILNFNAPGDKAAQRNYWQALAFAAYQAMSLVQFYPSKETEQATALPQVTQDPNGGYSIGGQKLDPANPKDAALIQRINASRVPGSGAAGATA